MLDHEEYPRAFIKFGNLKIELSNSKKINETFFLLLLVNDIQHTPELYLR